MISPDTDLPFEDGPIRAQLIGTWSYPDIDEPGGIAYVYFHESGIIFQFFRTPESEKRLRIRMLYSLESASRIRVRNIKGDQTGWTIGYRLEGDTLRIINSKQTYVCTRVAPEEVPEWFREAMSKTL